MQHPNLTLRDYLIAHAPAEPQAWFTIDTYITVAGMEKKRHQQWPGAWADAQIALRPADERAIAAVGVPFKSFDGNGRAALEALPKDTALAFMCHHGGRSAQAAEQFRALGFTKVFNVTGGINAWSEDVDNGVPKY